MTILTPVQFIDEVKQWAVSKDTLHKVRIMEKGEYLFFRFYVPHTSELLETYIHNKQYEEFDFMVLSPISIGAVWNDTDTKLLNSINNKLEELNAKYTAPDRNQSLWRR